MRERSRGRSPRADELMPVLWTGRATNRFQWVAAVAAQALRRIGAEPAPDADPTGTLSVLLSGRPGRLPAPALDYAEGRTLAATAAAH